MLSLVKGYMLLIEASFFLFFFLKVKLIEAYFKVETTSYLMKYLHYHTCLNFFLCLKLENLSLFVVRLQLNLPQFQ